MESLAQIAEKNNRALISPEDMDIAHHFGGGVYIKETHFKAGEVGEKHTHSFEHLSVLVKGSVELKVDGVSIYLEAPKVLTIKAEKVHQVFALTDVTWLCIHATDCVDPEQIDNVLIG